MGCDIHVFIERYNKDAAKWENLSLYKKNKDGGFESCCVYGERCYELSSILAGVRGHHDALVARRGLPNNLSVETEKHWKTDEDDLDEDGFYAGWHSTTWYDYCELDAYETMISKFVKEYTKNKRRITELESQIALLKSDCSDSKYTLPDDYDLEFEREEEFDAYYALTDFMNCIKNVLNAYDIYCVEPNEIRIIIWFDG